MSAGLRVKTPRIDARKPREGELSPLSDEDNHRQKEKIKTQQKTKTKPPKVGVASKKKIRKRHQKNSDRLPPPPANIGFF